MLDLCSSLMRRMMRKISCTTSGARPKEGSSSSSRRGRSISARRDGQHLLLAAGERAGLLVTPLLEPREIVVDMRSKSRSTPARSRRV